jgi:hypothetical protein
VHGRPREEMHLMDFLKTLTVDMVTSFCGGYVVNIQPEENTNLQAWVNIDAKIPQQDRHDVVVMSSFASSMP